MTRRRKILATAALCASLLAPAVNAPPASAGNPCDRNHHTHYARTWSGTYRYVLIWQGTDFWGTHRHRWRLDKYDRSRYRWVIMGYFTCSPGKWGA